MTEFLHIKSISDVYNLFDLSTPSHPLITIIRKWPQIDLDFSQINLTSDLYLISMKGKTNGVKFQYGRSSYDFEESTLIFIAPNQVVSFTETAEELDESGWSILFHPDLIRTSQLGIKINDYSFFNYDTNEALHLSGKERQSLLELVKKIDQELNQTTDKHSQKIIIQNLESILIYSNRYYDRQFYSRTNLNRNFVSRFEDYLQNYFSSEELLEKGLPSLRQCGEVMNMSGSYLSDLLRLETGKSAKDHIYSHLIDKAKTALLNSKSSISEIAYGLGFEYPQHFSKIFRSKVGLSPSEYRNLN